MERRNAMWHVFCLGLDSRRNCSNYENGPLFINFSIRYVTIPLATLPLPAGAAVGVQHALDRYLHFCISK